jgi:hypothetical protein
MQGVLSGAKKEIPLPVLRPLVGVETAIRFALDGRAWQSVALRPGNHNEKQAPLLDACLPEATTGIEPVYEVLQTSA